jgi:hypothetical protein
MTAIRNIENKYVPTSRKIARDRGIRNTAIGMSAVGIAAIECPTIASEYISDAATISGWVGCN